MPAVEIENVGRVEERNAQKPYQQRAASRNRAPAEDACATCFAALGNERCFASPAFYADVAYGVHATARAAFGGRPPSRQLLVASLYTDPAMKPQSADAPVRGSCGMAVLRSEYA